MSESERAEVAGVLHRNIQALIAFRREQERLVPRQQRVADRIARFGGSLAFVYAHAVWVGAWLLFNLVLPRSARWDPYPFVMLATVVSVEAIFLSTFVLITQNRMKHMADQRADLDLQISLLAEHEITRLIHMVEAIGERVGADVSKHDDLEELKRDIEPQQLLEEIEKIDREH